VSYCPGGERDHTVCGRMQATGLNHVSWRGEVARKLTILAEVRSNRPDLLTGPVQAPSIAKERFKSRSQAGRT
jgi:hypothetical protein